MACSQQQESIPKDILRVGIDDVHFDLMDRLESIELVSFSETALLGDIQKVIKENNLVYVVDGAADDVKIYDDEFKYLKTISAKGQGPGMYQSIFNVFVENGSLKIFSNLDMSILEYDLDGSFIKEIRLDDRPIQMISLDKGFVSFQNFNSDDLDKFNLTLWNKEGKELGNAMPYTRNMSSLIGYSGGLTSIPDDNSHFYYQSPLSDTLYYMNSDLTVEKSYVLSFVDNPYQGDIYNFGSEQSMAHGYISRFESPADNAMFVWYKGVEPPALYAGMIDFKEQVFHKFEDFEPKGLHYFVANIQFVDDKGHAYALPNFDFVTSLVSRFPESLNEFPEQIRQPILENAANEDFKYLLKFKFKD